MPPVDADALDAGLAAAFADVSEPGSRPSVLARLEQLSGRSPRVHLRETGEWKLPPVRSADQGERRTGRYRILGEIARGGVGVILKGRDVAVKVLRDDHIGNAELVQRFVEEAQIGGQLEHPGIVPVYELGVDDEQRKRVGDELGAFREGMREHFRSSLAAGVPRDEMRAGMEEARADLTARLSTFLAASDAEAIAAEVGNRGGGPGGPGAFGGRGGRGVGGR